MTEQKKTAKELEGQLNATDFFCDVEDNGGFNFNVTINDIHERDIVALIAYLKRADKQVYGKESEALDAFQKLNTETKQ